MLKKLFEIVRKFLFRQSINVEKNISNKPCNNHISKKSSPVQLSKTSKTEHKENSIKEVTNNVNLSEYSKQESTLTPTVHLEKDNIMPSRMYSYQKATGKNIPPYKDAKNNFPPPNQEQEKELLSFLKSSNLEFFDVFWNVYVPYESYGETQHTEVDLIITSYYGIFVFESKDLNGTLSGECCDENWCASYYSRDYPLYNPIFQNRTHVNCLSKYLAIDKNNLKPLWLINCTNFNIIGTSDIINKELFLTKENGFSNLLTKLENSLNISNPIVFSHDDLINIGQFLWNGMNVSEEIKEKHRNRVASYKNII